MRRFIMYFNTFKKPLAGKSHQLPYFGFHNEMGNILNSILHGHITKNDVEENNEVWFMPRIDIFETKNHYIVSTELAGVSQKDINLSIEKNILTISGEKRESELDKETTIYRSERNFGKFSRSIEFPEKANPEVAEAEFKNGVLTVKIEKYTSSEPKKIEIRTI